MKVRFAVIVILTAVCLLPSLAFGANEPVKIGDITAFTGEVLARTNGIWVKVKSTPHPVFSADKVVTRRGRAEIGLVDGGMIRLNLDSNVSIEQMAEEEGFAFKNKVSARQINLLVGEVWFSVRVEKGNQFKVRTPTMTAAVRGSAATIIQGVDPREPAKYSFIEGDIATEGSFISVPARALNWADIRVKVSDLPPSNRAVDNSNVQQAAVEATEIRSVVIEATPKVCEAYAAAQAAVKKAAESQAISDKLQAATLVANANKQIGEAAVLDKKAQMVAEQEKIFEAQLFMDGQTISEVQAVMEQLLQKTSRLEVVAQELAKLAEDVDKAAQAGDLKTAEQALQQSEQLMNEVPKDIIIADKICGVTEETTATEEAAPKEEAAVQEEAAATEELGYPEEETTTTKIRTREPLPDTQDLPSSSPIY